MTSTPRYVSGRRADPGQIISGEFVGDLEVLGQAGPDRS